YHLSSLTLPRHPPLPLSPYTTLFRSPHVHRGGGHLPGQQQDESLLQGHHAHDGQRHHLRRAAQLDRHHHRAFHRHPTLQLAHHQDRKSTRLNSSHVSISYAVFCLKKK